MFRTAVVSQRVPFCFYLHVMTRALSKKSSQKHPKFLPNFSLFCDPAPKSAVIFSCVFFFSAKYAR